MDSAPVHAAVAEASVRFGIPQRWIWAILKAESGGRGDAVSRRGAMGLMQLMPQTWRELRANLKLGEDPFDRRDNILAATAYLRKLHDEFGPIGALAAYNAGPGRYAAYLAGSQALPAETIGYVARLRSEIAGSFAASPAAAALPDWRAAALFPSSPQNDPGSSAPDQDAAVFVGPWEAQP